MIDTIITLYVQVVTLTGSEFAESIGIPKAFFSLPFLLGIYGIFFLVGWYEEDKHIEKMAEIEERQRREG